MTNLDLARAEFALATFAPDSDPNGLYVAMRDCQLPSGGMPQPQAKLCATREEALAWAGAEHSCYGNDRDHWIIFLPSFQDRILELETAIHELLYARQEAHEKYVASLPQQETTHLAQRLVDIDEYIPGNTVLVPNPALKPDPTRIWRGVSQHELIETLGISEQEAAVLFHHDKNGRLCEPEYWERHPFQGHELMDGVYHKQGFYELASPLYTTMGYVKHPERLEEWRKAQPKKKREAKEKSVWELGAEQEAKEVKQAVTVETPKDVCPF